MSDVVDNSHQEQRNDADPLPEKDPEGWFDVDGSNQQPKEVDHGFASTPNVEDVDKPLTNGQPGQEPENAFNETTTIVESNQSEPASVSWGFDQEPGTSHDGFAPNVETISDTSQRGKDEAERSAITARVSTIAFAETLQISDEGDEIGSVAMSAQEEPTNEPVRDLPQLCRSVSATFLHKHPPRPPFLHEHGPYHHISRDLPVQELFAPPQKRSFHSFSYRDDHRRRPSNLPYVSPRANRIFFPSGMSLPSFSGAQTPLSSFTPAASDSMRSILPDRRIINIRSINSEIFMFTKIRNRFMMKVYGILSLQLLFSIVFILVANLCQKNAISVNSVASQLGLTQIQKLSSNAVKFRESVRLFFTIYGFVIIVTFLFNYVFLALILIVCSDLRRHFPINLILMASITLSFTLSTTALTIGYGVVVPTVYGSVLTLIVVLTMSFLGYQTRWDLTSQRACFCATVYIAAVTGLVIGVLYAKGHQSAVLKVGIAGVEILLFALWMIHITRRITGGYGDISPDEYIFGALTLYVDLLLFLLFLLEIINYCRKL